MQTKSFDELVELANVDDAGSAYRLAELYRLGEGVEQNDLEALAWYIKAALLGSVDARNMVGVLMKQGKGVPEHPEADLTTLKQKADDGDGAACCVYGIILRTGWGCEADYSEAIAYLTKGAVEYRHAGCMNNLGVMYTHGLGVSQDDVVAVEWYRKAAEQGDASAQKNLGSMYRDGYGIEKDEAQAFEWYHKASEQGYASAQNNLGLMYLNGTGVAKDDSRAVEWFRTAANKGYGEAQFSLGYMYANGMGVEKDETIAVEWYRKAAKQGYAEAQNNLGVMYANGTGVEKDDAIAFEWYNKAAEQGYGLAQHNLSDMYYRGIGVEKDDGLSFKWTRLAAEQGDVKAQFNLGLMYEKGEGVQKSEPLATEWYRKAAERGFAKSQYLLAYRYTNGTGVEKNDSMAVEWYRKAAEQGHAGAQYSLGVMYFHGMGIGKDEFIALEYFRKAANQGHAGAQYYLGNMCADGVGVTKDETVAVEWYRKAAEQGHDSAQCRLGFMYEAGKGVPKDRTLAAEWFKKASVNGNPVAQDFYDTVYANGAGVKKDTLQSVKELTEVERHCRQALLFIRERRYPEAFKILEFLDHEAESKEHAKSVGGCDPTEAIHVGVDEEWNQHYVKGIMLERENKLAQAFKEARTSALIALERLGPEHVDFAASLNMLAELYGSLDRKELSFAFLRRSLVIRFRNLGLWHSEVAECLHNIAWLDSKSRPVKATVSHLSCDALALRIRVILFGKSHPTVALSLVQLGRAYRARHDFSPALKSVRKAIAIYEETIGTDHLMTQRARRSLDFIQQLEESMKMSACGFKIV